MDIKNNKLYLIAGLGLIITASLFFKANASNNENKVDIVGYWTASCAKGDSKPYMSFLKFQPDRNFHNTVLPNIRSNGTYEYNKNKINFNYTNINPLPKNVKLPHKTTYKVERVNSTDVKMIGMGKEKGFVCHARRKESLLDW